MKRWILALAIALILIPLAAAQDAYENDNTYQNSSNIPVNGSRQAHTFHASADQDYVNFTAIAGSRYIIETFNRSNIDLTDTIVYLYGTDGTTELASNDDIISGILRTSRISWNATSNGTFFLRVIEFSNSSGSSYDISVIRLGKLEPFLISPNANSNKARFGVFNFSTGVKCSDGFCYNISAYLDPEEAKQETIDIDKRILDDIELKGFANVIIIIAGDDPISIQNEIPGLQANVLSSLKKDFKVKYKYSSLPMLAGKISQDGMDKLIANKNVLSIEYDSPVRIQLDSSVPVIRANLAWPITVNNSNLTGIGQTICIIDTGINYSHSAFGSCAITSNINDGSCPKVVGGYDFVNNDNNPYDDQGHGTHVSGIAASQDATYRGVAPGVNLVAIKVLNSAGSGSSSDVIAGIEWCTNNASRLNISVISMSLGADDVRFNEHCNTEAETASINNAVLNNIIVVSAAGNNGYTDGVTTPACIENATSVGGVNDADAFSYNRGFRLDLAAPGISVTAPYYNGATATLSGTSMATPHAAGAAAIVQQAFRLRHNRTITPSELTHLLRYNGLFLNDIPSQTIIPRINVQKASSAKGIIPTAIGARPFYTLSQNPSNDLCLSFISDGQTCNQTWIVNATGDLNSTWEFFAIYEGKYNFNLTQAINITIIDTASVTLNLPADNSYSTSLVNFNCSATSQNSLANISLYFGNSTSLELNQTINITGTSNSTIFNVSMPDGNYLWNCLAADIASQAGFASANRTLIVDATNPFISITNQTTILELGSLQQILANVTDLNLNYVNISINGSNITMNLVNDPYNYSYVPFYNETVNYTIYAMDLAGNLNNLSSGFLVNDSTDAPLFYSVYLTNGTINYSASMLILATILDGFNLDEIYLDHNGTNVSMLQTNKHDYNYTFSPANCGNNTYKIYAKNAANYSNLTTGTFYATNCCGDNACETGETCSSCANDCGQCPTVSSSSSGGSSSGEGGMPITNEASESFVFSGIKAGETINVETIKEETPVSNIQIKVSNDVLQASVIVKTIEEIPETLPLPENKMYKLMELKASLNENDISNSKISFKVDLSWLKLNQIKNENIALFRLNNNAWKELPTNFIAKDDSYTYYEAESPGFSYFAIAIKKPQTIEKSKEIKKPTAQVIKEIVEEPEPIKPIVEIKEKKNYLLLYIIIALALIAVIEFIIIKIEVHRQNKRFKAKLRHKNPT